MGPSVRVPSAHSLRVLVAAPEPPEYDRSSGSLRLFRLLELISLEGHSITFVGRAGLGDSRYTASLAALGIDVYPVDHEWLGERCVKLPGAPLRLPDLLARGCFDIALLSFYHIAARYAPMIRRFSPLTKVVVDTVDVHHVREHRGAELSGDPLALRAAQHTRELERAVYSAADALIAVSDTDAGELRKLAPDVPISVIGNIHVDPPRGPEFDERSGLVFVGGFNHAPNVDAVLSFSADVWPLVRGRLAGAQLTIVGSNPPPEVQTLADEQVNVTGWVDDVAPYLDRARVSIAPLRYGGGVKGKVGEAMSHGLPVVTTTVGAEGFGLVDGVHALVADSPSDFADAIVRLHSDAKLWERLSEEGRRHVNTRLSSSQARTGLRSLLDRTLKGASFVLAWPASDAEIEAPLRGYLEAFGPQDPVSLTILVRHGQEQATFEVAAGALRQLGRDLEQTPDIEVTGVRDGIPLPARTVRVGTVGACGRVIGAGAPAGTWRKTACAALEHKRPHRSPVAAVALQAADDPKALAQQLDAVRQASLPHDVEVVIVASTSSAEVDRLLEKATGARIVRTVSPTGRAASWRLAEQASTAAHLIALAPLTVPVAGFIDPLLEALRAGAALAAPVVESAAGLWVADDGSLWPRTAGSPQPPQALPFDCLAISRELLQEGLPELRAVNGHAEVQLARWAQLQGGIAVASAAHVKRQRAPTLASAVVCTHNRCAELQDAVASLRATGVAEILIVDNASTDDTAEVIAGLVDVSGGVVRATFEPEPGLVHARIAAASAASHDLLLFIDDDARTGPGWLEYLTWELSRPGVVHAGGPLCALWPPERPANWPDPAVEPLLCILDHGDADRELATPDFVYGANWAIRREALYAAGGFDLAFPGYSDTSRGWDRIGGDEMIVAERLRLLGIGRCRYVANAAVGHRLGSSRLTPDYVRSRALSCAIEVTCRSAMLGRLDSTALIAKARNAVRCLIANPVLTGGPLRGSLDVDDVLTSIGDTALPLVAQVAALNLLGDLAASVALLGERELIAGDLHLCVPGVVPDSVAHALASLGCA